jgi:hypothetical protein
MVFQECSPSLGRRPGLPTRHQIGNGSFGDVDSQLEQFTVNPESAPERIGFRHSANNIAEFGIDPRPPRAFTPGFEPSEYLEGLFVPPHYGVRIDNDQSFPPIVPETGK